ncbi:MAG: alpha/beta hydrolase [Spirochaetota bacterium]
MAHIQLDFFSQALQVGSSVEVILPEAAAGAIGIESASPDDPPVLYLLHGLSDDHTIWMRRTSIERYAAEYGLAVVMPGVARSFYNDMAFGPAYWSYVSEEVPAVVSRFFRVGSGRQKQFVAGLSMGGFGALKLAFTHPDRFAAAASFSGAVDMASHVEELLARRAAAKGGEPVYRENPEMERFDEYREREYLLIFGDPPRVRGTANDPLALSVQRVEAGDRLPELYIACGTEDFLYDDNQRLDRHLTDLGVEHTYITEPGTHEWGFWDRHVARFLAWLRGKELL